MTAAVRNPFYWRTVLLFWAVSTLMLLVIGSGAILHWRFPDPDDQMRLVEVRDWLGGQSWFDVSQHRMNYPQGVPMHWSRLVDIPIVTVILLTKPFFGMAMAEHIALVVVPLLTLGCVFAVFAAVARQLMDDEQALLATMLLPLSGEVTHQLLPMRIDHHGWQLVLALLTVAALINPLGRRAGLWAGAAIGLWVTISLEGLLFVLATFALVALRWAWHGRASRLFVTTTASAAATALVGFVATHGFATWSVSACDALSPVYIAVLAICAMGAVGLAAMNPRALPLRLAGLGVIAAVALLTVQLMAPQCARGPFAALDPLVHYWWYARVAEGLPLWQQDFPTASSTMALPLVGLLGTFFAWWRTQGGLQTRWGVMLFLCAAATLGAALVQRAGGVAALLAMPGVIQLMHPLLVRARRVRNIPGRLIATLGALLVGVPAMVAASLLQLIEPPARHQLIAKAEQKARVCEATEEMAALRELPRATILAPLDASPAILVMTDHRTIGSGHHRNAAGMRDVIAAFIGTAEEAHQIVQRRNINYIVICPGTSETLWVEGQRPRGFLAQIDAGHTPDWLAPVTLRRPSPLKVWRVRQAARGGERAV